MITFGWKNLLMAKWTYTDLKHSSATLINWNPASLTKFLINKLWSFNVKYIFFLKCLVQNNQIHLSNLSSSSKFKMCCKVTLKLFLWYLSRSVQWNTFPFLRVVQLWFWRSAVVQEWCLHFWPQWSDLQLYICEWSSLETYSFCSAG